MKKRNNTPTEVGRRSLPSNRLVLGKDIFSTGQVAAKLGYTSRYVAKLIDRGRLLGFRMPGSQVRRVSRQELLSFAAREGIAIAESATVSRQVLAIWLERTAEPMEPTTPVRLINQICQGGTNAIAIGCVYGVDTATQFALDLVEVFPWAKVGVVLPDDRPACRHPAVPNVKFFNVGQGLTAIAHELECTS